MLVRFPRPVRLTATIAVLAGLLTATAALAQQQAGATLPAARPAPQAQPPAQPQAATPDQLFADWDRNKDKQLSLQEFKTGWADAQEAEFIGRLSLQFRQVDLNHSGFLEASEYANLPVIKRAGGGAPPFATFDVDANKTLDFKEYVMMVQAIMQRGRSAKP